MVRLRVRPLGAGLRLLLGDQRGGEDEPQPDRGRFARGGGRAGRPRLQRGSAGRIEHRPDGGLPAAAKPDGCRSRHERLRLGRPRIRGVAGHEAAVLDGAALHVLSARCAVGRSRTRRPTGSTPSTAGTG